MSMQLGDTSNSSPNGKEAEKTMPPLYTGKSDFSDTLQEKLDEADEERPEGDLIQIKRKLRGALRLMRNEERDFEVDDQELRQIDVKIRTAIAKIEHAQGKLNSLG